MVRIAYRNRTSLTSILDPDARMLAEELDGFPLALATAGAYLHGTTMSFEDYLRQYKESWAKLQQISPEIISYEDRTLYSTWQISYDRIKIQNELSANLIRLWAYFDNHDLWFELLRHPDSEAREWIHELTEDELNFNKAIRVLTDHGLVEPATSSLELIESRGYSIHSCVHSWTIHVLNQEWDDDLAKLAVELVGLQVPDVDSSRWWLISRRILPHAARISHMIVNGLVSSESIEWACYNMGGLFAHQGKLEEAEKMYIRALQGYEKAFGTDHKSTLHTVNNLGNLYSDQGKMEEAEAMYIQALQGKEKALGADHKSTLQTVNNLGTLYAAQGKMEEAEAMYVRSLQGYEKALGADHTSTLQAVNNLGNLYSDQGKLEEAEMMYVRALQGREKTLGANHVETMDTVNNLAVLFRKQGKLEEAETLYLRSLQGYEKALGPITMARHRPALNTIENLGNLFEEQGKLSEAKSMFLRAHSGLVTLLGPSNDECPRLERKIQWVESVLSEDSSSLFLLHRSC